MSEDQSPKLRPPTHFVCHGMLAEKDAKLISQINTSLDKLNELRAVEINVAGPFLRSKIAWKLATYQHHFLHRLIALMDGAAVTWNARSTLATILCARAVMETFAVMTDFEDRVAECLDREDLGQLDAFVMRGIFASRDPEWIEEFPDSKAVNVLTLIDAFDKRVPGFRGHYDRLSERCHPNSLGHNFMFSKLDRTTGSVAYSDERNPDRNIDLVLGGLAMFPYVETVMSRLDDLILKVSDLQHRLWPVGGPESDIEPPHEGSQN